MLLAAAQYAPNAARSTSSTVPGPRSPPWLTSVMAVVTGALRGPAIDRATARSRSSLEAKQ